MTYGTSRVMLAADTVATPEWKSAIARAVEWALKNQNADGGWGGGPRPGGAATPSTIEETAWMVESLATLAPAEPLHQAPSAQHTPGSQLSHLREAIDRGVAWLIEQTSRGTLFPASPVGFYFAKLWYWERLYPLIWTTAALSKAASL